MITRNSLPEDYEPLETLTVCSNVIKGGGHLICVSDVLPLVVGRGKLPQLWLQALANAATNEFVAVVEATISKHPLVKIFEADGRLNIEIASTTVVSLIAQSEANVLIDKLDMRPLGFDIFGDSTVLNVGGNHFSRNIMSGGGILISMSAKPSPNKSLHGTR